MVVVEPLDGLETKEIVKFAIEYNRPMYIRIGRDGMPSIIQLFYV